VAALSAEAFLPLDRNRDRTDDRIDEDVEFTTVAPDAAPCEEELVRAQ
jgi:hypothetical protein